jgi:uncharacterized protein YbaP (TraB family)
MALLKRAFIILTFSLICFVPFVQPSVWAKNTLWEIKTQTNSVYLQGSVHLLKSDNYPLNHAIKQAFDDSQVLVLETDLANINDQGTKLLFMEKGILPGVKTLDKCISAKTYDLAKRKTSEFGLDIQMFGKFKPWFFAMTIATIKLQELGYNSRYGLDSHFFLKAREQGKKVVGLETVEYQMNLFDSLSDLNQELLVHQTLKELEIIEEMIDVIIDSWSKGDIKRLENTMLKSFKEYPSIYETFITKRNRNWMTKIESFLKDNKNYMVVVGAGHLTGKDGLILMLKKRGYPVRQL